MSTILRTTQSCVRVVSPIMQRHANRVTPAACAPGMSTDASSKDSKTSKKSTKAARATSVPPPKAAEPVDKGDMYRSGEEYFGFNPYSFYDIENSVQPLRCPQPSGEKMKQFCLDKLNPEDEPDPRKLLAEDYGDLEEYPGKPVPRKSQKPVPSVMQRSYNFGREVKIEDGAHVRARMPL